MIVVCWCKDFLGWCNLNIGHTTCQSTKIMLPSRIRGKRRSGGSSERLKYSWRPSPKENNGQYFLFFFVGKLNEKLVWYAGARDIQAQPTSIM